MKPENAKKMPSPFDLNSNDNPGSIITQVQLKGDNYEEWARAIRTSLRARRKWGFIEGKIAKPNDDCPESEEWWTVQSMIVSWILNTIEPGLRSTVSYTEDAATLWKDIKDRFSIANGPRVQQLKAELADCKQKGLSIVAYYGRLKLLWDELMDHDQYPLCNCGGCKCEIGPKIAKKREEERVHQFLMGLDGNLYGTVRSSLLATEPLPTLNRVYSTLIQEERVKDMARTKDEREDIMALTTHTNFKTKGRGEVRDKSVTCTHCKRSGHGASDCFQLVGYPDWWGDRPRDSKPAGRGNATGGRGRGGAHRVNAVQLTPGTNSDVNREKQGVPALDSAQGVPALDSAQWASLLELLNSHKANSVEKLTGKNDDTSWIIDTGATNHMTGSLDILKDKRKITACPVGMPNGNQVLATDEGSTELDDNLVLSNVLYVPGLSCSLISVSQIIDENDCVAVFSKNMCVLQDRTSKMLIGAGERKDGLYYFRNKLRVKAHKVNGTGSLELWHARLGHPSLKITKMIPTVDARKGSNLLNKA